MQGKGWFYHRIPATLATALALLALGTAAARQALRTRAAGTIPTDAASIDPAAAALLAGATLVALTWLSPLQLLQHARIALAPERTLEARLAAHIRTAGARSYLAFSRQLQPGFPVVNETGVAWASRFPSS